MITPTFEFHLEITDWNIENQDSVKEWLLSVCELEKIATGTINYIFCSDEYLLNLNMQYLGHDFYTDILSFPLKKNPIEGDIFISVERVRENSEIYGISFFQELLRVMVHGLLHFLGYDDHEKKDIERMREKEDHYISHYNTLIEKLN